jgi:2-hydroxychromene-2-carboxylate isomerase
MHAMIFYYDVVCPYAYLASTRVEALAARTGAVVEWTPILLGGVFRALHAPDQPATAMPAAKARLNRLDLARYAFLYGVELTLPPEHPRRTVEAMRLCHAASGEARIRLTHALYRAYFAEGRDVSDRGVLAEICVEAGVDPQLANRRIDDDDIKEALRAATGRAVADGVFGVPAFVVDGKLYWGQDRMHLVERALCAR